MLVVSIVAVKVYSLYKTSVTSHEGLMLAHWGIWPFSFDHSPTINKWVILEGLEYESKAIEQ